MRSATGSRSSTVRRQRSLIGGQPTNPGVCGDHPMGVRWYQVRRLVVTSALSVVGLALPPAALADFGPPSSFAAGDGPQSVAAGDLNRDGKPDLAVANELSDTVSIHLGAGSGTFAAPT